MRLSIFAIFTIVALCVVPSYQYGTMFADNITPAFEDQTFFRGIKTGEGFSTDAAIGSIQAQNVAGFSINTPGPIDSASRTLSFVASQGIEFGASALTVDAAGDLSITGQRIDFDSSVLDFEGAGDVTLGGIKSQIRAFSFELDVGTDMHLSSSGSILDINAPVGISMNAFDDMHLNAGNNVEILSRSGEASFSSSSIDVNANYIDIDGEVSFSATSSNVMNLNAAAIAEFASVGSGVNDFDILNIDVSSGDIVLDAAGILTLQSDQVEASSMLYSADRNTFVVSRSAAESIIRIDTSDDFVASASNILTFGTFEQESDLHFSGQDSTAISANDVAITTTYGHLNGRNDMSVNSVGDMNFSVTAQDLSAVASTGNVEFFASGGSFSLSTDDDFVTSATDSFIDTQSDINMTGSDVSFRQNNIDATGALRLDSASDIVVSTGFLEFDTSGFLDFTIGGDFDVSALRFNIAGSKGEADVVFNIDETVTIDAGLDLSYTSDMFSMATNRYLVDADFYNTNVDTVDIFVGDTATYLTQELLFNSVHKAVGFIAGDSFTANLDDQYEHRSMDFTFDIGNSLSVNAFNTAKFVAQRGLNIEVENQFTMFVPDILEIDASNVAQFLQRDLTVTSNEVTFAAGDAIYHSQNLPSDTFQLQNVNGFEIIGSAIQMVSGADFILRTSTDITLNGDTGLTLDALNLLTLDSETFDVLANGIIDIASGGELDISVAGGVASIIEANLIIDGPEGEHGLLSFNAATDFDFLANADGNFFGRSITFDVDAFLSTVSNSITTGGEDGVLDIYAGERLFFTDSDQFTVVAGGPISIFGRDSLEVTAQSIINLFANTAIEIVGDSVLWDAEIDDIDISVTFDDGRLTFEGDSFSAQAGSDIIFTTDFLQIYSGSTLTYANTAELDLFSDTVTFNAPTSYSSTSLSLVMNPGSGASFLSGGDMLFSFAGNFENVVAGNVEFESSTFKSTTSNVNDWNLTGEVEMNASDGVVSHFAENFGQYIAGTSTSFDAQGGIYHDAGSISYTGEAITAVTSERNGDVVFDSTSNRVTINAAAGELNLSTLNFASYDAFNNIDFSAGGSITVTNGGDFDFFADVAVRGTIVGNLEFTSGASGHFEAGNRIEFDATNNFQVNAGANFLASTGEQGILSIESSGSFTSTAGVSQSWKSSDQFETIVTGDVSFTTIVEGISMFTTTGDVEIESDLDFIATVGGSTTFTSGEQLTISSDLDQAWTSTLGSISSTADQGNVIIDFDNDDATFTAGNAMLFQSKGARNPTDGFKFNSDQNILFFTDLTNATAIGIFPQNSMDIGAELRPSVQYLAGGSPTIAGITVNTAGDMITHADNVFWDSSLGTYTTDVGGYTHMMASDAIGFTAVTSFTASANSDIFIGADQTLIDLGTGTYDAVASGGLFKFTTNEGRLVFGANQNINVNAKNLIGSVGNDISSIDDLTTFTISGPMSLSTNVGEGGSIELDSSTMTFESVGATTLTTNGPDGSFDFNVESQFSLTTQTSGDITLSSAGDMDFQYADDIVYTSVNSLSINANNNLDADLTDGIISFRAENDVSFFVGDSFTISAVREGSIIAETDIDFAARSIAFSAADDIIIRGDDITQFAVDSLIFENTVGLGGDFSITTRSDQDIVDFSAVNDITWNIGQNVIGESFEGTSFLATGQTNKQESIFITTTADNGDLIFSAGTNTVVDSNLDINISTLAGASGVFDIRSQQVASFEADDDIEFISENGSISLDNNFGSSSIFSNDGIEVLATGDNGRIVIEAAGISRSSESAIAASTTSTSVIAGTTVNIDAWESVELLTSVFPSSIVLGHLPDIDLNGDFDLTGTGTTRIQSQGPASDIVFNVLEPQYGLGSISIIAGNSAPAESHIDFAAIENFTFEQESGISFQGFLGVADADRNSDIFFSAEGVGAGIEISTDKRAALADIRVETRTAEFDADDEVVIRSSGSRRATTNVVSQTEKVIFTVDSNDADDKIDINGYHGDIEILGRRLVSVIGEGTEVTLNGRLGLTVSAQGQYDINLTNDLTIGSLDGDTNLFADEDLNINAFDDVDFLADGDITFDHFDVLIDADDVDIISRSGNIYFNFGQRLDFSNVNFFQFSTRNSLTIPMREAQVVPGTSCETLGEFCIAHNNFYYNSDTTTYYDVEEIKDTGVMICYCAQNQAQPNTAAEYFCRPLASTIQS